MWNVAKLNQLYSSRAPPRLNGPTQTSTSQAAAAARLTGPTPRNIQLVPGVEANEMQKLRVQIMKSIPFRQFIQPPQSSSKQVPLLCGVSNMVSFTNYFLYVNTLILLFSVDTGIG